MTLDISKNQWRSTGGKDPVNLGISLGGLEPWNKFQNGRSLKEFKGRNLNLNLGEERKKNKGKKNKQCMDDFEFFEILAFFICDQDGDQGLTWPEVSECIVSHINTSYLADSYISFTLKLESRQKFCSNSLIRSSTYGKKNISDFPPWLFLLQNFPQN